MKTKFCWDASQLRYEASQQKNEKNWDITKSVWLDPSIRIYEGKFGTKSFWWKIMVFIKQDQKPHWIWAEIDQTESNWELVCIVSTCITQDIITQHTKLSVNATLKFFGSMFWFVNNLNFADVPLRQNWDFVDRISFLVIGNNIQLVLNIFVWRFWCSPK